MSSSLPEPAASARTAEASRGAALRVGYVLKMYPRLSETFVLDEILGIEAAGVEVSVYSLRLPVDGKFQRGVADVRGPVRYLPGFGSSAALEAFHMVRGLGPQAAQRLDRALAFLDRLPEQRRASLLVQGLHLAEAVQRDRLQHLHAHFMTVAAHTAYLAHVFTDVPFTVTAHAKDIYREAVDPDVFREVAGSAVAAVTVCEANRSYIQTSLLGVQSEAHVVRIYNGLALDRIPPGHDSVRERSLLLGVGRLVEKKGYDVLLRACRILADRGRSFRCVVIGEGDQRGSLLSLRGELGLQDVVELPGAMPRDEILGWMARARALVAPCVTGDDGNRDALPTVALEALASSLPIVATRVGGIPEIVDHDVDGLLVEEGDAQALAAALERMLEDDLMWTRLSRAGRRKAELRFDREATVPQLIRLFGRKTVDVRGDGLESRVRPLLREVGR
jgi:colanic acid/amylovoran biosynthesis glycosyltransferase